MKLLIYFFSCLLLSFPYLANAQIFGKSPEEKCFDAQMKVFEEKQTRRQFVSGLQGKSIGYTYHHKQMTENNSGDWKFNEEKDRWMSKSAWEADAWARCMRK